MGSWGVASRFAHGARVDRDAESGRLCGKSCSYYQSGSANALAVVSGFGSFVERAFLSESLRRKADSPRLIRLSVGCAIDSGE